MKKAVVTVFLLLFCSAPAFAGDVYHNAVAPGAATVTTAQDTKAIYCGVTGGYDIYIKGSWVAFTALTAGVIYPIQCTGIRDADDSDADAGDILYLY